MNLISRFALGSAFALATLTLQADPASTYPGMDLLDPDPENISLCHLLPLEEDFSDATHYDGTSQLPTGWANTGSVIWRTANEDDLPAVSGQWYMIAIESRETRDERAYTPFFHLLEGVTYTIDFYTHQEATTYSDPNTGKDVTNLNTINLKVGTQQDRDFLPVSIATISSNDRPGVWVHRTFTFSPAKSGAYCFCFEMQGVPFSGYAAIDMLTITSPRDQLAVKPLFHPFGLYSASDGCLLSMGSDPVRMVHYVSNGTPTAWEVPGMQAEMLPGGDAHVYFTQSGMHEVTLTATNTTGDNSLTKRVNVMHLPEAEAGLMMYSYDPGAVRFLNRGDVPSFNSDPYGLDYVTGFNHYYSSIAEYFPAPHNAELTISGLQFLLTNLRYAPVGSTYQGEETMYIKIYGVDDYGHLDENRLMGSYSAPTNEILGTGGIGATIGEWRSVRLKRRIKVTGPFFVVFEYPESLLVDPLDPQAGRSFASMGMVMHPHTTTTLYCKPYKVPMFCQAPLDKWCPVSDLHESLTGAGLNLRLDADYAPGFNSVETIGEASDITLRMAKDNATLLGTHRGQTLSLFDASGRILKSEACTEGMTEISLTNLPRGLYFISVGGKTYRIAR